MMTISAQPREEAPYSRLKALTHYHAPAGREALLAARHREKRAQVSAGRPSTSASATPTSSPAIAPCQHPLTSTTRCGQGVIPMSRFCPKHILEQPNQVLFRACGVTTDVSDGPCETPVPALFAHSTCVFHTRLLPIQSTGPEESRRSPVPDISSLVTEVLTAANNTESMQAINNMDSINNEATDEVQPNRECVKEEVPEVTDEIDNVNKEFVDENRVNNQNENNGPIVSEGNKEDESGSSQ